VESYEVFRDSAYELIINNGADVDLHRALSACIFGSGFGKILGGQKIGLRVRVHCVEAS
jgi:hypothetical protein